MKGISGSEITGRIYLIVTWIKDPMKSGQAVMKFAPHGNSESSATLN